MMGVQINCSTVHYRRSTQNTRCFNQRNLIRCQPPNQISAYPNHPFHLSPSQIQRQSYRNIRQNSGCGLRSMATISSIVSSANLSPSTVVGFGQNPLKKRNKVIYVEGLNSFGGLKAHNKIASLGFPVCTNRSFAKIVSSLKSKKNKGGGALSSTCNAASEIFNIAAIMNGLVLVGVAVGFVLLRIEATLEESEN